MAMREPSAGELDRRILVRLRSDIPAEDLGLDSLFTDQKIGGQKSSRLAPLFMRTGFRRKRKSRIGSSFTT